MCSAAAGSGRASPSSTSAIPRCRAPFDGQMGKHLIDPGNVVGGNGQHAALARHLAARPDLFRCQHQHGAGHADPGQSRPAAAVPRRASPGSVEAALRASPAFPHRGTIEYVAPAIDASDRHIVRARHCCPIPTRALLPGVFVKIRLPMGKSCRAPCWCRDRALQEDQGGRYRAGGRRGRSGATALRADRRAGGATCAS